MRVKRRGGGEERGGEERGGEERGGGEIKKGERIGMGAVINLVLFRLFYKKGKFRDMQEKEFIEKLKRMKEIKADSKWAVLTLEKIVQANIQKKNTFVILSQFKSIFDGIVNSVRIRKRIVNYKLAFASVLSLFLLFGVGRVVQDSLPGDLLFPLKKAMEDSQSILKGDEAEVALQMAQDRLDDLIKIAQENSTKNLGPAIDEYQKSVSKVANNLIREKNKEKIKKIVSKTTELEKKEEKVKSYGVVVNENKDLEKAYIQKLLDTLNPLIEDLKKRDLTEKETEILKEAEKDIKQKKYDQALLKLLSINKK